MTQLPEEQINWEGVIKHCHYAASQGQNVTQLFKKDRSVVTPCDYDGPPTVWPSQKDSVAHFADHAELWDVVRSGYEWRTFVLWDIIHENRKACADGSVAPGAARVTIDSCFAELKIVENWKKERAKVDPKADKPDSMTERLQRAKINVERQKAIDTVKAADAKRRGH